MFQCICCQELVFRPITTVCQHNVCKVRGVRAGIGPPHDRRTAWACWLGFFTPGSLQGLSVCFLCSLDYSCLRPSSRGPIAPLPCSPPSCASLVLWNPMPSPCLGHRAHLGLPALGSPCFLIPATQAPCCTLAGTLPQPLTYLGVWGGRGHMADLGFGQNQKL